MFNGFSGETVDFIFGLSFNNEKSWFEAHKEEYLQHFYRPMKDLASQVFQEIDGLFPNHGFTCRVSRIYRDARRLRGRGPYKDSLWFIIERPTDDWSGDPVFWFEFGPDFYSYGLGCYCAKPITMAKFRARLDNKPKDFQKLVTAFGKQERFQLEHETYKRAKGDPSSPLHPWYNSKGFSLMHRTGHDKLVFTPELVSELVDGFASLMPFYDYLITLPSDPDPRDL